MINTENIIDTLIENLKKDNGFENVKLIKAYPNYDKPTRLSRIYIAMGIMEMNLAPYQMDYPAQAGELTIFADLYCPLKWDSGELTKLFSKLCNAVKGYNPTSIRAEKITADAVTQSYQLKTAITFYNEFDLGGEQ